MIFNILDTSFRSGFCYSCLHIKTAFMNGSVCAKHPKREQCLENLLQDFLHCYSIDFCHFTRRISVGFLFTDEVQLQAKEILCGQL